MVVAEKKAIETILIQTLLTKDRVMLKSLLDSFTYSRSMQLKSLLSCKKELGGFTPLQFVCLQGNPLFASILIDRGGTDVNEKGMYGWTALHAAASGGDAKTVKLLLNSGADCFVKDDNGNVPLDYVCCDDVKQILKELMQQKNLEFFENQYCSHMKAKTKLKVTGRSNSCFVPIGSGEINGENISAPNDDNNQGYSDELGGDTVNNKTTNLKRWKTFSNLAITNVYSDSTKKLYV